MRGKNVLSAAVIPVTGPVPRGGGIPQPSMPWGPAPGDPVYMQFSSDRNAMNAADIQALTILLASLPPRTVLR